MLKIESLLFFLIFSRHQATNTMVTAAMSPTSVSHTVTPTFSLWVERTPVFFSGEWKEGTLVTAWRDWSLPLRHPSLPALQSLPLVRTENWGENSIWYLNVSSPVDLCDSGQRESGLCSAVLSEGLVSWKNQLKQLDYVFCCRIWLLWWQKLVSANITMLKSVMFTNLTKVMICGMCY